MARNVPKARPAEPLRQRPHMTTSPKPTLELKVYVSGETSKSWLAFSHLEVVDLLVRKIMCRPGSTCGRGQQRRAHKMRKITGNLSDRERVLVGLDIIPREDYGS